MGKQRFRYNKTKNAVFLSIYLFVQLSCDNGAAFSRSFLQLKTVKAFSVVKTLYGESFLLGARTHGKKTNTVRLNKLPR